MDGHLSRGLSEELLSAPTEHQITWWGSQVCRRCNPGRLNTRRPEGHPVSCTDCNGSGWTKWASLATSPWNEIIPGLWVGGHDYNQPQEDGTVRHDPRTVSPESLFDTVISMYSRPGCEPGAEVEHLVVEIYDGEIGETDLLRVVEAANIGATRIREGKSVLSRCQAGLNRSSLVAGLTMIWLGFSGEDAVQLIRSRRSPWALCNERFEHILKNMSVEALNLLLEQAQAGERAQGK